jgi:phosphoribosylanthranilate isomerase
LVAIEVKICGIRTLPALEAAIAAGADYFGLVFYARSPRNVSPAKAAQLAERARGRIKCIALVVDADDTLIADIAARVRPDMIQLHGKETPERATAIRKATNCPVIKAISVSKAGDPERAKDYKRAADLILFDAKPVDANALPGGNGLSFDWRLLDGLSRKMRYMLSGGLNPVNVGEAIRLTGAAIVDVSSGVEVAPGKKQAALIRRFVEAAKAPELEEIRHG